MIERERRIELSAADAALIVEMLENPSKPNAELTKAFERYQSRIQNGTLHKNYPNKCRA